VPDVVEVPDEPDEPDVLEVSEPPGVAGSELGGATAGTSSVADGGTV
jgi:hypothetical protein